jgi:hypothetical protein
MVLETQRGLFVTRDVRANNLSQATSSEKILDKLILAESDYVDENLHDDVLRNNVSHPNVSHPNRYPAN